MGNALFIVCIVIFWYLFAPTKLGGNSSYVIVDGNSMEPKFHTGDLVILAKANSYQVGDVVSYMDPMVNAHIIHRIIGVEDDHFIMKGDNNNWIDLTHPMTSDVLGKKFIYLPKFGNYIKWLRVPGNMSLVVGLFGGGIIMSMTIQTKNPNMKRKSRKSSVNVSNFEIPLYFLGVLAIAFLGLIIFSFSKPLMKNADKIPYTETGEFSYSASGTPSAYDSGSARSGEPIFLKITCNMDLSYKFSFFSPQAQDISGFYHLIAVISDQNSGWQRTLQLTPDSGFSGLEFSNRATLDICRIISLVNSVEAETGFHSGSYNMQIVSEVTVKGKLSGFQFLDKFEHPLAFRFDSTRLYMGNYDPANDPFHKTDQKLLNNPLQSTNYINMAGVKVAIRVLRIFGFIGLIGSVLGLFLLGMYYSNLAKSDQALYIKLKYGSMIVDASISGPDNVKLVIDVTTMEELVNIATRQNALILHMEKEMKQFYLVENDGTVYRYSFTAH